MQENRRILSMVVEALGIGGAIVKAGRDCEDEVITKILNWQRDSESHDWLKKMSKAGIIEKVKCYDQVGTRLMLREHGIEDDPSFAKADATAWIKKDGLKERHGYGISIKRVSIKVKEGKDEPKLFKGFNQLDRGYVERYEKAWSIPEKIANNLRLFTGEIKHHYTNTREHRRLFLDEMSQAGRDGIINWFYENRYLVVRDILMGRGARASDYLLVGFFIEGKNDLVEQIYNLKCMKEAVSYYGDGDIGITEDGSLKIGNIAMQRKGGDGGKKTANQLQFKFDPSKIVYKPKKIFLSTKDMELLERKVELKIEEVEKEPKKTED
jgi:hypothetical protein